MNFQDTTDIIMNPVRQRIIQFLLINKQGTTKQIQISLSDVPSASLYRHIKKLCDYGFIKVVEEKRVRGTIEKTYAIEPQPFSQEPTNKDLSSLFYSYLLSLQGSFIEYFADKTHSPETAQKDILSLTTSTLMLSDDEYMLLLKKIGELIFEVAEYKPNENRKQRRLTFISSPPENV